jgi:nucleoside-diphosphate-sugar epimerase
MPEPLHVLVTGSAGRLGRAAVRELQQRGHRVRGFDRAATPALSDCIVGDLGDRTALQRAMDGIQCLVHLAATPDDDDVLERLVPDNVIGLFHVMESAREAGVQRIILASSTQVNWWQRERGEVPIRVADPPTPKYWYAATKMFMEAIGCSFVETHGISVLVARLGWCPRTRAQVDEIAALEWAQDMLSEPRGRGPFLRLCRRSPGEHSARRRLRDQPSASSGTFRSLGFDDLAGVPATATMAAGHRDHSLKSSSKPSSHEHPELLQ